MVLIITSNDDLSTNQVIDWLDYSGTPWFRINESDTITVDKITISGGHTDISIKVNDRVFALSDVLFTWYRRGYLNWLPKRSLSDDPAMNRELVSYVNMETKKTFDFIYYYLGRLPHLSAYHEVHNKKLEYLIMAAAAGLTIPHTLICCTKAALLPFFNRCPGGVATKSIHENYYQEAGHKLLTSRTYLLQDLADVPEQFSESLFQEYIKKVFELRAFFAGEQLFAMAIFSQENEQTKVDFRQYDHERPNRTVPFSLPLPLEKRLIQFIRKAGLSTGSIDMIYAADKRYVFLEVNPVGQFGMVSFPCNYYLERLIAKKMSAYERSNQP